MSNISRCGKKMSETSTPEAGASEERASEERALEGLLLDVVPRNRLGGTDTSFFVYDRVEEKISEVRVEMPHLYCSERLGREAALELFGEITSGESLASEGASARIIYSGESPRKGNFGPLQECDGGSYAPSGRYELLPEYEVFYGGSAHERFVVQVLGPRGLDLGETFNSDVSVDDNLRYRYPIFSEVKFEGLRDSEAGLEADGLSVEGLASAEEISELPLLAYDIETDMDWTNKTAHGDFDGKYSRVNTIAVRYEKSGEICSDVRSIFDADVDGEDELIAWLENVIRAAAAPFVGSHNFQYDALKLREFGEFRPGVDGSVPVIHGVIAPGIQTEQDASEDLS